MKDDNMIDNEPVSESPDNVEWEVPDTFPGRQGNKDWPSSDTRGSAIKESFLSLKKRPVAVIGAAVVVLIIILTSQTGLLDLGDDDNDRDNGSSAGNIIFGEPVMLPRQLVALGQLTQIHPEGAIGYEPSLAVDSTGAMFYTAHKDLVWQESWDYLSSWWFISTDNGVTWRNPDSILWNVEGKFWAGDEGDIAVDARDRIYFVDTTLIDNNFHVFSNRGDTYEFSKPQGSTLLDDRPWLTAQGDGILHYLGNNGVAVTHPVTGKSARVWYYKSTDRGLTWTGGIPMEGGWATIDCEHFGDHVYVAQVYSDGGEQNIVMYVSDNQGEGWNERVIVGPMERNGIREGMPTVFSGANGRVYVIWQDSPQAGDAPATLYFARSEDYGKGFEYWNISLPEGAIYLYPTVNVCQYEEYHQRNRLGISFYGTTDIPVDENSDWYLYAAVAEDPMNGTQFDFQIADPQILYTGDDLHALHDFFEIVIAPDGSINIGYQVNIGEHPYEDGEEQRYLMFLRGEIEEVGV